MLKITKQRINNKIIVVMVRRDELAQELANGGVDPPAKFLQNAAIDPAEEVVEGGGSLPQVDISLLTSPSPSIAMAEVMKLHSVFSTFGCCMVVNHGMSKELMKSVRGICNDFFKLPKEEKSKYARPTNDWQGYGSEIRPDDYESHDWSDRLQFKLGPESQRDFKFWPAHNPPNFRDIMKECNANVDELYENVMRAMAKSLELEEKSFLDEVGEHRWLARFNLYPKCSRPDRVLGVDAHSDGSIFTILLLDVEVDGYQLFRDGRWVKVPFESEDGILIQVGDQGEIISNGEFKSPLHRVAVNTEKERKSVLFTGLAEKDKVIGPVKALVNETNPPKYKNVVNYERIYVQNTNSRTLIESLKI